MDLSGINMNDSTNLSYYSQLLVFQRDSSDQDITFSEPSRPQQQVLHSLALKFGFDYEYSRISRTVTISRSEGQDTSVGPDIHAKTLGTSSTTSQIITAKEREEEPVLPSGVPSSRHSLAPLQEPMFEQDAYLESGLDFLQYPCKEGYFGFDSFQDDWQAPAELLRDPYLAALGENFEFQPNEVEVSGDCPLSLTAVTQHTPPNDMSFHKISNPAVSMLDPGEIGICTLPPEKPGFTMGIPSESPSSPQPPAFPSPTSSIASGRSGPLNPFVAIAQKAVKAVGACWRCKILRKSCDPQTPCFMCPKGQTGSHWWTIGCKRGTLKSELPSVNLCSGSYNQWPGYIFPNFSECYKPSQIANSIFNQHIKGREAKLEADAFRTHQGLPAKKINNILTKFRQPLATSERILPGILMAQEDCITAITWEINNFSASKNLLGEASEDITDLLYAAALHHSETQARSTNNHGTDQLIPESLICLRTCLEAIQVNDELNASHGNLFLHVYCPGYQCEVEYIANITMHLDLFVHELSRVLFLKENLYHKSWWLSVFYSLCIQSYARKILIRLAENESANPASESFCRNLQQFLHLAVRLFNAASGSHDPLVLDYSLPTGPSTETEIERSAAYQIAQTVVQRSKWKAKGIFSTADYLKYIFEDTGVPLDEPIGTQAVDQRGVDGITNSQIGGFPCSHPGCTAQPFQTQYLLNSHANVHSSNRPHFCSVEGCPRSEGGRGFKRKNEMIRHSLVHTSPRSGYVCPFCLDREHKYNRPDQLQRHVRVHHVDKDKDDPKLREVLAQTREEPSRGRKRRRDNEANSL